MLRSSAIAIVLIIRASGFRQHADSNVGFNLANSNRDEEVKVATTRWEQCIWHGPEGSGFRVFLGMELGERQDCVHRCRGKRYEMNSRVMPRFFTHSEEAGNKCACFVAGKKKYSFKRSRLAKECDPNTCWSRYQSFLNWKEPRHQQISFSNMEKIDVTCRACQSSEDCKDSVTLPTPWSINTETPDKSDRGGEDGLADNKEGGEKKKTVAPEVANFLVKEGIEFYDSDTEEDEVEAEVEDKGHDGNGGDVKEDVHEEEDVDQSGGGICSGTCKYRLVNVLPLFGHRGKFRYDEDGPRFKCCVDTAGDKSPIIQDITDKSKLPSVGNGWSATGCQRMFGEGWHVADYETNCFVDMEKFANVVGVPAENLKRLLAAMPAVSKVEAYGPFVDDDDN